MFENYRFTVNQRTNGFIVFALSIEIVKRSLTVKNLYVIVFIMGSDPKKNPLKCKENEKILAQEFQKGKMYLYRQKVYQMQSNFKWLKSSFENNLT